MPYLLLACFLLADSSLPLPLPTPMPPYGTRGRSCHTQLAKTSFDEIIHLTAEAFLASTGI